jgi:hypothetical protein
MIANPPATTNATPLTHMGMRESATVTRTPKRIRNKWASDTAAKRIVAAMVTGFI